jgi:hypothetical protein
MSLYCLWVSLMLRTYSRIIALIGMVAASAQAADETLTLACKGRETSSGKGPKTSEVIDIGIIVDFQKKIVTGFFDSPSPPSKSIASQKRRSPLAEKKWITRVSFGA